MLEATPKLIRDVPPIRKVFLKKCDNYVDRQRQEEKDTIDGFIQSIDTSKFDDCPAKLSQIASNAVLYAKELSRAYVKAMGIMQRVNAGKTIPKQEFAQVDREITQSLTNWKSIIPLFDTELESQYSRINQEH